MQRHRGSASDPALAPADEGAPAATAGRTAPVGEEPRARRSLRSRPLPLDVALLASVLIPALLFALLAKLDYDRSLEAAETAVSAELELLHEHAKKVFELQVLTLDRVDERLRELDPAAIRRQESGLHEWLGQVRRSDDNILGIGVTDDKGEVLVHSRVYPAHANIAEREYFRIARESADPSPFVTGPYDPVFPGGRRALVLAKRRVAPDGGFAGVYFTALGLDYFLDFWAKLRSSYAGSETHSLLLDDGTVLVRNPPLPPGQPQRLGTGRLLQLMTAGVRKRVYWAESPIDGRMRVFGTRRVDGYPVYITYGVEKRAALAGWYRNLATYALLTGGSAIALLGLILAVRARTLRLIEATRRAEDNAAALAASHREIVAAMSEREAAEQARRISESRLRRLTEANVFGMAIADLDGKLSDANAYFLRTLGVTAERLRQGPLRWRDVTPPEWASDDERALEQLLSKGAVVPYEKEFLRPDGTRVPVVAGAVSLDPSDPRKGFISFLIDVTDLKRAEQALREADRRKDEFIALLAHELRNPLAPIVNAVAMLGTPGLTEADASRAIEMVRRQAAHLTRLVDDLLDVSRITRGKLTLQRERVHLGEVLAEAIESSRPWIAERGHRLECSLAGADVAVDADRLRLAQVFLNLLSNAAKYTPGGGVIGVRVERGGGRVVVRVSDSGVGISPEHLRWVFEPFWQVDQSVARTQGGLGLGLTLVKSLVELHGGEVSVRSEGAGRGSEFSVSLPVAAPAGEREGAALPATPTGRRPRQLDVVVADDNRDAADSLAMLLGTLGHTVRVAYDGGSALALIESWMPQLALLDIGMPGLDGYELARRIRAASWGHRVRLVALTGWGQASDVERARAAGFDAHLTKPAELLEIEGVLALAGR